MSAVHKILIVEHNPTDVELLHHKLKKRGINYISETVQNEKEYRLALKNFIPDIILSDYTLPNFSGPEAFKIKEQVAPSTPFIIVSGTVSEEISIALIRDGVTDYVLKDKLFTLPVKINRALKEAQEKQQSDATAQELKLSEKRLARAQQIAHLGSWELDLATNTVFWSAETCRIYGLPPDQNQQSFGAWLSYIHPDDLAAVMKEVEKGRHSFQGYAFHHRIVRTDGSIRYIYAESKFDFDEKGKPISQYGIAQDVTDRNNLEKEVELERKRFYDLFLHAPSCMGILKGPNHVYEMANPLYLQLIGKTDIIGKAIIDVLPEIEAQGFIKILDEVYKTGNTFFAHETLVNIDRHGTGKLVGVYLNFIYEAYKNSEGKTEGIFFFVIDVTEQVVSRKKIEQGEKRYRTLIEKSSDIIALTNIEGKLLYCSPSITAVLGYLPQEFIGARILDIIHPADLHTYMQKRNEALKTDGYWFQHEMRLLHKNGNWIWCEGSAKNMLNEPGIQAMVSNIKDISATKILAAQREFDHNNLNALINNNKDLIWSIDKDFKLISFNKSFQDVIKFATGKELAVGDDVLSVAFSPAQHQHFKLLYSRAFAGESFTETEHIPEPANVWTEISYVPIFQSHKVVGAACLSRDITAHKISGVKISELNQKLQTTNLELSSILNTLPANIALLDKAGIILSVNESWIQFAISNNMRSATHGVGDSYIDVCTKASGADEADGQKMAAGVQQVLNGKRPQFTMEYPCHSPTEKRWFRVEVRPLSPENNTGAVVMHLNITPRKLAELEITEINSTLELRVQQRTAELTEAITALDTFSYSVSHDLRSPVRTIMGFTKIITKDYAADFTPEVKQLFGHIETSSMRINTLITDLLTLAKSGKEKMTLEKVDLYLLFKKVWDNLLITNPHKARLVLPLMPVVMADASMMEQVIVNLLGNAIKYSSKNPHPHVVVGYETDAGFITIYVEDNGAGFDMKHYEKLFVAFQRLHGVTDFEGSGIGLSLVKRIILRHGGQIWATAKPDEGATFFFSLPHAQHIINKPGY